MYKWMYAWMWMWMDVGVLDVMILSGYTPTTARMTLWVWK